MEAGIAEKFLAYMAGERNRSPLTVAGYADDLRRFEDYYKELDGRLSWETIDSDIIRDWMESMMDKGNTSATVCRRLSAVRSLYRYALSRGLVDHDPAHEVTGPKKEKALPQFVRENEMDQLMDSVEWGSDFGSLRARTIIIMFYSTGIRLAELVGLDDDSIDFAAMQIKVRGKRDKERVVPFGKELAGILREYMARRDASFPERAGTALFVGRDGNRIDRHNVQYEVRKRLSAVCTQKKKSPHVLRHAFATAMLNHRAGLESVKKLLGHESLSTTQIYTHTTFDQLRRVYETSHPREQL